MGEDGTGILNQKNKDPVSWTVSDERFDVVREQKIIIKPGAVFGELETIVTVVFKAPWLSTSISCCFDVSNIARDISQCTLPPKPLVLEHWRLGKTLAWILWRDINEVLKLQDDVSIIEVAHRAADSEFPTWQRLQPQQGIQILHEALESGRIKATGLPRPGSYGTPKKIPRSLWSGVELLNTVDDLRSADDQILWSSIRVKSSSAMQVWGIGASEKPRRRAGRTESEASIAFRNSCRDGVLELGGAASIAEIVRWAEDSYQKKKKRGWPAQPSESRAREIAKDELNKARVK